MTGQMLGYARVSTDVQNPDLQVDALERAGCDRTWVEHVSGTVLSRPRLGEMLEYAREGDTVVVWRLDRLGRSVKDLIWLMGRFQERGIGFRSLTEGIDTSTPGGVLFFHVFAALAQFETDLTRARTAAGLEAARARGRVGGRPRSLAPEQAREIDRLLGEGMTVAAAARTVGTSRATVYRHLRTREESPNG